MTHQSANPETGFRKVSQYGAIQDTNWTFDPQDLPVGEYSWKVQSIDASNLGSLFSEANPLTIPDTLKLFNNVSPIAEGSILGGTPDVVFFSFGINSSVASTLDSLSLNMTADYQDYLAPSSFRLFQSVDATADLSPEDEVVNAVSTVDGNVLSLSELNIPLSQQQVYFFLVANARFVAAEGSFGLSISADDVFVREADIVAEPNTLSTRTPISVESASTIYTPVDVSETVFEASSENQVIMSFSLNTNAPGVRLRGLSPSASTSIASRFENIRVYASTDNNFDTGDSELGAFTVTNNTMESSFNFTLTNAQTDYYFFVVADIQNSVRQSTESITFTLDITDLDLSATNRNSVSFTTAPYTFFFDRVDPVILYSSFNESVQQGSGPHTINFTVQDQSDITAVSFFWRQLSAAAFQEEVLTVNSGNAYDFAFTAANIGDVGVEFYASATDADGNVNNPDVRSIGIFFDSTDPIDLKTEVGIKLEGESVTDYSLLAFPFQQGRFSNVLSGLEDAKHGALAEFFSSDQKTKWRLISLDKGASSAAGFNDLDLSDTFRPGEGYYLIVGVKDVDIQVVSGETVEASSDDPHSVSLAAGWNMIGNPYLFSISLESIRDYNLAAGNIVNPSVINDIRLFRNGQFVSNPTSMDRFDGAFIRVTENVSNFEFPMNDELPSGGGGRIDLTRWDEQVEEDDWRLNLTITQGGQMTLGGFGLKEDASDDIDVYDQYVLPAPGDYIRMQHEINDELSVIRNSVQRPELVNVWKTSVYAVRDGSVKLEWDTQELSELSQSLYLFDPTVLRFVDMKSVSQTAISVHEGNNDLLFYYGPEDLKEEQLAADVTVVGTVYPNPVFDRLKVNVMGAQDAGVQLKLFDLFGKQVLDMEGTLQQTGINQLDIPFAQRPQSGLYFLEVQVQDGTRVIRSEQKIMINE